MFLYHIRFFSEAVVEQEPEAKSGLFSSAPVLIGLLVVGFCVVSLSAGVAVGGVWYMLEGPPKPGAHAESGGKKHNKKHSRRVEDVEGDEEEETAPAAQAAAPTPAAAPVPGGRKLGVTPTPGPAAPGPGPVPGTPGAQPQPAKAEPAAATENKPRRRFSNSTPDPNAEAPK